MGIVIPPAAVGAPITAAWAEDLRLSFFPPIVRLTTTTAQNTSGTPGAPGVMVAWNTETYDDAGCHDNVTNNSRITIPAGWGGYYRCFANIRTQTNANTTTAQFAINGVIQTASAYPAPGTASLSPFCPVDDTYLLSVGDYVEVNVFNTAASQAFVVANCFFGAYFVHP